MVALVVENEQAEELMPGVEGIVVLDKTPFYAEMGGQVADHGVIASAASSGCCFTRHRRAEEQGRQVYALRQDDRGRAQAGGHRHAPQIDQDRRKAVMRAHSATHLLDKALRTVLGDHVHQAGSLVEPDRLRFDFTHFSAMTARGAGARCSRMVNEAILEGYDIHTEVHAH